jgi:hypothetical protein
MEQISRTARIILNDRIEKVFPLFSPLGEKKWVNGWSPDFLFPINGDFKENLVFKTESSNTAEEEYNWITSYLSKEEYLVVYTVFTENRVWTIKVQCIKTNLEKTEAQIIYTFTGLNKIGDEINRDSLEKMYSKDLKDWEHAINYYLDTGELLID